MIKINESAVSIATEAGRCLVGLHLFRLKMNRHTTKTRLNIERDYDARQDRFLNAYTITLTADGRPLADKKVELWYVARYARFNADRSDPDYKPASTPQCEFYAISHGNRST